MIIIPQYIFLDSNIFNECVREDGNIEINGVQFKNKLLSAGYIPIVGRHTTYELAKTYKEKMLRFRGFFKVLKALDPLYTRPRKEIYKEEIANLRGQKCVITNIENNKNTLEQFLLLSSKYSRGIVDNTDKKFICDYEQNMKEQHKNWDPLKRETSSNDLVDWVILLEKMGISISESEASRLRENLDKYPMLRSLHSHHFYLNFNTKKNQQRPSIRRLRDGLQLIESSYCEAFLTTDKSLREQHGPSVNNNIKFLAFDDIYQADTIPP